MLKNELSLDEVTRLIEAENARRMADPATIHKMHESDAEQQLNAVFETNKTLAVYGTLAPGLQNYHIVEPLGGEWTEGSIEGDLQPTGWGATLGYPAFRPRVGGPILKIRILKSELLAKDWARVDEFEGPEYKRILIPVFYADTQQVSLDPRRLYTVANIYAASD